MTTMPQRFTGKVALITGAGSGIGLATARAFAREGASVVIADKNMASARQVAADIEGQGGTAIAVEVDVGNFDSCAAMVEATVSAFGRLDIAFNNAGIPSGASGSFDEIGVAEWDRVMSINVNGVFYCMKAEVPALRQAGGGAIINAASSASFMAVPGLSPYITSKHAVAGLTKAAALDLIGSNVRVNAICPGMTATPMMTPLLEDPDMRAALHAQIPAGHLAEPDDMAQGVLFLASDAASYAVGTLLRLDGGLTLG
jgi:NAD(P)-dependent dehydrogenase (short-subunit alcohol dehydrogenase family)